MTSIVFIKIRVQSSSLNFLIQYYSIWIHSNKKLNPFHSLKTCSVYRQSENLPRTRFSEVTSDINSWNVAFIKSRADTSTYLHWDVGYEQPSLRNRAQDVQKLFITPGQQWHVNNHKKQEWEVKVLLQHENLSCYIIVLCEIFNFKCHHILYEESSLYER